MKIFLDPKADRHRMSNRMKPHWNSMGIKYSNNPKKCDVQLCFGTIQTPTNLPKIVRLDGVYYDTDRDYHTKNKSMIEAINQCKGIIYQSKWGKKMAKHYLFPPKNIPSIIIYNGADDWWSGEKEKHNNINIVSTAKWRRHKRLQELCKAFIKYKEVLSCHSFTNKSPKLYIIGPIRDRKGSKLIPDIDIIYLDKMNYKEIAEVYRKCDIFLHASKRDCCPCAVVEAIAAHLKIVTTIGCGGAVELVKKGGEGVCGEVVKIDCVCWKPVAHYRDEWNIWNEEEEKKYVDGMIEATKKINEDFLFPEELSTEFMARAYGNFLKKCI